MEMRAKKSLRILSPSAKLLRLVRLRRRKKAERLRRRTSRMHNLGVPG